jgi:hypothetical protein
VIWQECLFAASGVAKLSEPGCCRVHDAASYRECFLRQAELSWQRSVAVYSTSSATSAVGCGRHSFVMYATVSKPHFKCSTRHAPPKSCRGEQEVVSVPISVFVTPKAAPRQEIAVVGAACVFLAVMSSLGACCSLGLQDVWGCACCDEIVLQR